MGAPAPRAGNTSPRLAELALVSYGVRLDLYIHGRVGHLGMTINQRRVAHTAPTSLEP